MVDQLPEQPARNVRVISSNEIQSRWGRALFDVAIGVAGGEVGYIVVDALTDNDAASYISGGVGFIITTASIAVGNHIRNRRDR